MSDKTESQVIFEKGRQQMVVSHEINGIEHILVPKDCDLKSMERLMPAPLRIKESPEFNDPKGFNDYITDFKEEGTRIFVDELRHRFVTIFDCHAKGKPAWGDHSASLKVHTSNEWERFKQYNGVNMSPIEFAEFIEDNMAYFIKEGTGAVSAADLLNMAQTFKIKVKGEFQVDESLHAGMKSLIINDESTLRGQDKKGKEIKFPEKLYLNLRIFKNCDPFKIEIYLRHRTRQDKLMFFIKIPDPDSIQEQAFDVVLDHIKKLTKLPTLKGSFDGPSHRR